MWRNKWLLCCLIQVTLGSDSGKIASSDILALTDESQDLREKLAILKGQVDEMFEEIKNQNHAVFKQADHSRILSGKVSNMSKEIKLLKEENSILRDQFELHEFKTGKRLKKVKQKLDILAEGLVQCCPSFLETEPVRPNHFQNHDRSHLVEPSLHSRKKGKDKKEHKRRRKEERKERRKKKYRKDERRNNMKSQVSPPGNPRANLDLESLHLPPPPNKNSNNDDHHNDLGYGVMVHAREPVDHLQYNNQNNQYGHQSYGKVNTDQYIDTDESSQILITGGSSNSSEYFDANSNGYLRCPNPPSYPIMVEGAFGTFIEGHPLICGGRSSVEDYYKSCYFYQNTNNSWVKAKPMMEPRFQASVVMIDSKRWWITSGFSGEKVYNNTEIYETGVGFRSGPTMPAATFQHCLVKVNSSHIFTVGGFPYSRNTWLMDFEAEQWTRQRPINHLRNAMLILGGHEMGGDLDELDLVYQYDPMKEIWTVLNQRLRSTRTSFVAISLPNYYTCSSFPLPTTPTPYGYQPGSKIFF
ncbi:hypothetical protein TCAL_13207 [Tigriopus californicus]|uniref:Uncharacterized protein n=1 Tax=Tigriopus californicus TaxID=6832 RepID=A0A553PBP2_TIGCA|nr:hypothetical protein TCAL_13207 [Tigriopus californicus]|eukprot:TCALIF_13207-PA protein Name:"Protein of unknown function" AED:0.05 eAED:0.05 QI:139/0.6/0.66/1/0.8/0.83/6/411/526